MPSFQHIEYFTAFIILIPVVLLFLFVLVWKKRTKKKLGDAQLVSRLTDQYSPFRFRIKFIIVLIALSLCIMAAANLRKPEEGALSQTAGIDVMIALDLSKSMLSNDIKPNRLERARQVVQQLTNELKNNRIGLVVFAGRAFLQLPLTTDITEADMMIANSSPEIMPVQGTNISDALYVCNRSLDVKEKSHKAIVLITDGEAHDKEALKAAQEAYDNGVVIYTIGIGTAEGSLITEAAGVYKKDAEGNTIITKLNEDLLKQIASVSQGKYFHLENAAITGGEILNELNSIEKKPIEGNLGERNFFSFTPFLIALAILLLIVEIFISETKKNKAFDAI